MSTDQDAAKTRGSALRTSLASSVAPTATSVAPTATSVAPPAGQQAPSYVGALAGTKRSSGAGFQRSGLTGLSDSMDATKRQHTHEHPTDQMHTHEHPTDQMHTHEHPTDQNHTHEHPTDQIARALQELKKIQTEHEVTSTLMQQKVIKLEQENRTLRKLLSEANSGITVFAAYLQRSREEMDKLLPVMLPKSK